jgi:replication-associated recombination protein RarA
MRPRRLAEFLGQEHVIGAGTVLRRALERGELF